MAEASSAFLRGRAAVYRRMAQAAATEVAAEDFVRLAELWEAEAAAADSGVAQQPAPSIRRAPKAEPEPSIRKAPAQPAVSSPLRIEPVSIKVKLETSALWVETARKSA